MSRPYQEVKEHIKGRHHLEVVIHPLAFDEERIPTNKELLALLRKAKVSLRGWDFPYSFQESLQKEEATVVGVEDYDAARSAFRAHHSGLFQGWFECREEDLEYQAKLVAHSRMSDASFFFDWGNLIYCFCECFEFARRMASHGSWTEGLMIRITLHKTMDAGIGTTEFQYRTGAFEKCVEPKIHIERSLTYSQISAESHLATNASLMQLFEAFSWGIRPDVVAHWQKRFFSYLIGDDRVKVEEENWPSNLSADE